MYGDPFCVRHISSPTMLSHHKSQLKEENPDREQGCQGEEACGEALGQETKVLLEYTCARILGLQAMGDAIDTRAEEQA